MSSFDNVFYFLKIYLSQFIVIKSFVTILHDLYKILRVHEFASKA